MIRVKSEILAITCLLAALAGLPTAQAAETTPDLGPPISLRKEQIESLGLRTAPATHPDEYLLAILPGVIVPPPNQRVAVAATFPGVVLQTYAVEGQAVTRGDPLAVIASHEILTAGSELAQARARLAVAEAASARMERLAAEGIVAGARAEETAADRDQARAEVGGRAGVLAAVNADAARGTYTLKAPIDGVVARANIQTGDPVDTAAAPFVIDSGRGFEIEAQIPEHLVGRIAAGMRVSAGPGLSAKVTSAGRVIQPETRSALMKALIAPGAKTTAGKIATISVFAPTPAGALVVPRAAVTTLGEITAVFVRTPEGFAPRKVAATIAGNDAVVTEGLRPGDEVVIAGLTELKSIAQSR